MARYVRTKVMRQMEAYEQARREEGLRLLEVALHREWRERDGVTEPEPPDALLSANLGWSAVRP
jgi:hypothetical protein